MTNQEFIESIRLEGEEWRDVVGYEGYYMVSNRERIAAIRTYFEYVRNGKIFRKKMTPHICSTSIAPSTPYRRMTFVMGGKHNTELFHVIVARAFVPNPNNYPLVDHIDDNPKNNKPENLQWVTYKMNNSKPHHRMACSLSNMGRVDPKRKPIVAIRDGVAEKFYSSMFEAHLDGHNNSAMLRVLRGKLKTHHGFHWMYLSDYEKLQAGMSKNS